MQKIIYTTCLLFLTALCSAYPLLEDDLFVLPSTGHIRAHTKTEGSSCELNKTTEGICMIVTDCPDAVKMLRKYRRHTFPRCGWNGLIEIVCCPIKPATISKHRPSRSELACERYSSNIPVKIEPNINNGENASIGEFPHMAAVGYDDNGVVSYDCGGTLISESYIITAAHCLVRQNGILPSTVKLGKIDIAGDNDGVEGADYPVETSIIHPGYRAPERYNDLALLRLARNVTFTNNILPACLFTLNDVKGLPFATGWGDTSQSQSDPSPFLQKIRLPLKDLSACNETYVARKDTRRLPQGIIPTMLCAGPAVQTGDTCRGDSGGPLVMETSNYTIWSLIGVTSFGVGCGGNNVPGVYTRISSHISWIEDIVWPQ